MFYQIVTGGVKRKLPLDLAVGLVYRLGCRMDRQKDWEHMKFLQRSPRVKRHDHSGMTCDQAIAANVARSRSARLAQDRRTRAVTLRAMAEWAGLDADADPLVDDPWASAYWGRLSLRHLYAMADAIVTGDSFGESEHAEGAATCAHLSAELHGCAMRANVLGGAL